MTNQSQVSPEEAQELNEIAQLSEEEVKKLVMEVLKNPEKYKEESKYLLKIVEDERPGNAFVRYRRYKLLYGDVEKIELEHIYDYPYTDAVTQILIPRTKIVIVLEEIYDETVEPPIERAYLHVFSPKTGWRVVEIV